MTARILEKSLLINASPETVWSFLVDKDKLAIWYHAAENDLADGAEYTLVGEDDHGNPKRQVWGRVLDWDEPSKLVTTFNVEPFTGAETVVTWVLQPTSDGTRLTLRHEGIAEASGDAAMQMLKALDTGWDEHLGRLQECCP